MIRELKFIKIKQAHLSLKTVNFGTKNYTHTKFTGLTVYSILKTPQEKFYN